MSAICSKGKVKFNLEQAMKALERDPVLIV
jgi:hypothetical protein